MAIARLHWYLIILGVVTLRTLNWVWALCLLAVNGAGIFAMYCAVEFFYYVKRNQETRFK